MKKLLFILLIGASTISMQAQELNFTVKMNTQKVQTTDPKVFESLQIVVSEFLNSQKWTEDVFEPEERIECNLLLTITQEIDNNTFAADITIQASRPIFNSDAPTALLTHVDKNVVFDYEAYQPVQFIENNFESNLAQVLAFYSYVILGLDYDSFSPKGGEKYFQKAQEIINNIPPSAAAQYKGWRSLDGNRNRYWIIESILSPRAKEMRTASYQYHRQSLDLMAEDTGQGRAYMLEAIRKIETVNRNYPNAMVVQMFANAKGAEIVEIFKGGNRKEQNEVIRIMTRIDPTRASLYRSMQ